MTMDQMVTNIAAITGGGSWRKITEFSIDNTVRVKKTWLKNTERERHVLAQIYGSGWQGITLRFPVTPQRKHIDVEFDIQIEGSVGSSYLLGARLNAASVSTYSTKPATVPGDVYQDIPRNGNKNHVALSISDDNHEYVYLSLYLSGQTQDNAWVSISNINCIEYVLSQNSLYSADLDDFLTAGLLYTYSDLSSSLAAQSLNSDISPLTESNTIQTSNGLKLNGEQAWMGIPNLLADTTIDILFSSSVFQETPNPQSGKNWNQLISIYSADGTTGLFWRLDLAKWQFYNSSFTDITTDWNENLHYLEGKTLSIYKSRNEKTLKFYINGVLFHENTSNNNIESIYIGSSRSTLLNAEVVSIVCRKGDVYDQ